MIHIHHRASARLLGAALAALTVVSLLTACGNKNKAEEEAEEPEISEMQNQVIEVDTMVLRRTDFNRQMVCNGHLRATRKSTLRPRHASDILASVLVQNGQRVGAGTLLAVTDETEYRRALSESRMSLEKAQVDLADQFIGLGYNADGRTDQGATISAAARHRAELASGYATAKFQYQTAEQNLRDCRLTAPFAGRIADLKGRAHQSLDENFCSLIDDSWYDVEFSVLEAELPSLSVGQTVLVSPFVDESFVREGRLTNINPTVNEKGLVTATARIKGGDERLVDGMNVRVVVERQLRRLFVVPKEAVVERDGYKVVFVYRDGHAIWTYVDVTEENLTSYVITGNEKKETTIEEGDVIITSGNLNLADNTAVTPRARQTE